MTGRPSSVTREKQTNYLQMPRVRYSFLLSQTLFLSWFKNDNITENKTNEQGTRVLLLSNKVFVLNTTRAGQELVILVNFHHHGDVLSFISFS